MDSSIISLNVEPTNIFDTNIPSFSTGVGLVIRGYEDQRIVESESQDPLRKKKAKRNGFMDKFLNNIKTWFEEEQDY